MTLSVGLLSDSQRIGLGTAFLLVGWANIVTNGAIIFVSWLFRRTTSQPNRILFALAIGYLFNSALWAFAPTFFDPGHGATCFFMMMHTFGRFSTILMEFLILVFAITTLLNQRSEALWSWKVEGFSYVLVHVLSLVIVIIFGTVFDWPCGSSSRGTAIDKVDIITELWLAILGLCLVAALIMIFKYKQLRTVWLEADEVLESGWYTSVERHQKKTIMKVHQDLVTSMVDPLLMYPLVFILFAIPDVVKVTLDSQWGQSQRQQLLSASVNLFAGLRGIAFAYVFFKEGDNKEMLKWANISRKWKTRRSNTHVVFGSDEVVLYSKSGTLKSLNSLSTTSNSAVASSRQTDSLRESLLAADADPDGL